MRRLNLVNYTVPVRNDQGAARFKEAKCECGLDLTLADPVNVKVRSPKDISGNCPQCSKPHSLEAPEYIDLPYYVRDSMIELLFNRDLRLNGRELLKRDDLARRIRDCHNGSIFIEEEEWGNLVHAAEVTKGLGRPDVELIRRIIEAEKIEVEAKK